MDVVGMTSKQDNASRATLGISYGGASVRQEILCVPGMMMMGSVFGVCIPTFCTLLIIGAITGRLLSGKGLTLCACSGKVPNVWNVWRAHT